MVADAVAKKDQLIKKLSTVRTELAQKKASSETLESQNEELSNEVERLEDYA